MRVRPFTDDELPDYISTTNREYAEDKHTNGGVPLEEAYRQAEKETAQLFPEGRLSPGHAVLIATDDAGSRIGRRSTSTSRSASSRPTA